MENSPIHIEASLQKGKLIFKRQKSLLSFIDALAILFFEVVITIAFPFITVMVFLNNLENLGESIFYFLLAIFSLCLATYMSLSLFFNNRLKRIQGISGNKNRSIVKKIFKKPDWKLAQNNQQITIFKKSWNWTSTHYGRQLTVLYDGKSLLINCATFSRHHSRSPFHWYFDRKTEREFQEKFKEYLAQKQS